MTGTVIATDRTLSADDQRALRALASCMIPASAEYGVPGADDAAIFAEILAAARASADTASAIVRALDASAAGRFADLDATAQHAAAQRFRTAHPLLAGAAVALVVPCYYRDDRVMRSLGMEPRPPFPRGYEIEQGDWSLLDPVRSRPRLWRDAPP